MRSSYAFFRRGVYLSAIDGLPGLDRHAHLLAVALLEPDARSLAFGSGDRDLGNVHGRRRTVDTALRVRLARLAVAGRDVDAVNHHLTVLRQDLRHRASTSLVLTGQNDDLVTLLDLRGGHYSTSGASEMIFINPLERSSRTTGPKIRVPIGSSLLLTSTAALLSKRITLPSGRRTSFLVRTITAR